MADYAYIDNRNGASCTEGTSAFEINTFWESKDVSGTLSLIERTLLDLATLFKDSTVENLKASTEKLTSEGIDRKVGYRRERISSMGKRLNASCDILDACLKYELCCKKEYADMDISFGLEEEFHFRFEDLLVSLSQHLGVVTTIMNRRIDRTYHQLTAKDNDERKRIFDKSTNLNSTDDLMVALISHMEEIGHVLSEIHINRTRDLSKIIDERFRKDEKVQIYRQNLESRDEI